MRHTRLATALALLPLAAVACGTATGSTSDTGPTSSPPTSTTPHTGTPDTARAFAAQLLAGIAVPDGARVSAQAPTKAFDRPPEMPSLGSRPVVLSRFWDVDLPAAALRAWLRTHTPATLVPDGTGTTSVPSALGATTVSSSFLAYRVRALPASLATGEVYLRVEPAGPHRSALGAYALTLAQPVRPAAELVPMGLDSAVIGWSLAPGGTPVRKTLTGAAAQQLARDFDRLPVSTAGVVHCPVQIGGTDVVVTFRAGGHTWRADVPSCPSIRVTRDGATLPALQFGAAFSADLERYVGREPGQAPPPGGVIPLVRPPAHVPAPTPASPR